MDVRWFCLLFIAFPICFFNVDAVVIPKESLSNGDYLNSAGVQTSTYYRRFFHGFLASIYVVIVSELGDKTFFIAAIMSIDHPRILVYAGAMSALITMTVLSALMGYATEVLPRFYTHYLSGFLLIVFGLKMLKEAFYMKPEDTKEEYKDVENELISGDTKRASCQRFRGVLGKIFSPVFAEAFLMTFLAEWGDRSQMTTIVLAATEDVSGVIIGGILGHGLCTSLAVLAGRIVAQRIPVKWLTYFGGLTFLMFGFATFATHPYTA